MDREQAERRVDAMLGFYLHLGIYVVVTLGLVMVNALTWSGMPWALFPVVGWGIAVTMHGVQSGVVGHALLARWRRRKIDELLHAPRQ